MTTPRDLEAKFWKALKSDRTMMLGIDGIDDGHSRPMTAQIEGDAGGPIWFFTSTDNALVKRVGENGGDGDRAIAAFTSKDHEVFASRHGALSVDKDAGVIDRLWNPYVAAWFEGGKTDPKLTLLRLDAEQAEIWLNESSLFAGIKILLGSDPKEDYKDKVAEVSLR